MRKRLAIPFHYTWASIDTMEVLDACSKWPLDAVAISAGSDWQRNSSMSSVTRIHKQLKRKSGVAWCWFYGANSTLRGLQ